MDIALYITDLLKDYDEVGIPGLGTFYKKKSAATFDKSSNRFYPPSEEIAFRKEETENSLLTRHITKEKNISESSASYFAEKFGETVKTSLSESGTADLAPLGTLQFQERSYHFTPSAENSFNGFYGLEPVPDLHISLPKEEEKVASPAETNTQPEEEENKFAYTPTITTAELPEDEEDPKAIFDSPAYEYALAPKKKKWPVVLAIFGFIIILGTFAYITYPEAFNVLLKPNTAENEPRQTISMKDSLATADSIMQALQQQGFDVDSVQDTVAKITTTTETLPSIDVTTYEIIGASLPDKKQAETYIQHMRKKGIDARIVENEPGRLVKVSLGSFTDIKNAQKEKRRIQKDITKSAWIYVKKNKNNK